MSPKALYKLKSTFKPIFFYFFLSIVLASSSYFAKSVAFVNPSRALVLLKPSPKVIVVMREA